MQINTLITHEPCDTESTRAQHSQQCNHSHASLSSGARTPPYSPDHTGVASEYVQACIKGEANDDDMTSYTYDRPPPDLQNNHNLKRASPESDEEEDNGAAASPDKKVPRLSGDPRPSTENVVHEFACPFYKRNRGKYCHQRSCRTSGWPSVHRVKEHLYRHHMHYVCDRCSKTFKIQDHLREHLRQEEACRVSPRSVAEDAGFDAEIEKRLRSRKKIEGQNEVDKWNHMFRILFPSFSNKQTPYPFVDYSPTQQEDFNSPPVEDDVRDERAEQLQMVAMAAFAKHESGSQSPTNIARIVEAPRKVSPGHGTGYRPEFTVYPHDGPEGVPPGLSYRSNTDPRILLRNDMYEMVQQQVWKVLSSIPNSPMAPIPHRR